MGGQPSKQKILKNKDVKIEKMRNALDQFYFKGFYESELRRLFEMNLNNKKKLDDCKIMIQNINQFINHKITIETIFSIFNQMGISHIKSNQLLNETRVNEGGQA